MNILLISPYFSPMVGGVETHLDDLCALFNKYEYTVYVRTYKAFGVKFRGLSDEKIRSYIYIHRIWWPDFNLIHKFEPYPILKFLYLFPLLLLDCLLILMKKNISVDLIQAHGFIAALIAVVIGKLFNKKVVVNTHVSFKLRKGLMTSIIKWTLFNSQKVLVLTNGIKSSLINLGIPENKIEVYHYWVDQKKFKKIKDAKRKLGWENKFVVLFVGRLIKVKGIQILFDIARKLKKISFVIIGSGPLAKEIKLKSKFFNNIYFLGEVNNSKLSVYYSGSDLLLIPSRIMDLDYQEGIPRVMIEALYCGLPVIATPSGGFTEIFSSKIGLLAKDKKSIITAITKLSNSSKLLNSLSRNTRLYANKYFSKKNFQIIKSSLN